jgi:hypothetical protein
MRSAQEDYKSSSALYIFPEQKKTAKAAAKKAGCNGEHAVSCAGKE